MASTFNYTTKENERWDYLAYKMYGSIAGMKTLMDANPYVALSPVIPTGSVILVPIVNDTDDAVITTNLPPWKR